MGKVTWGGGIKAKAIDNAERSQFQPYGGPPVPNGMYAWRIKHVKKGKSQAGNDQLIVGLELAPRRTRPDEKKYSGFFMTDYITLTEAAAFRVAAFLDAIGEDGMALVKKTFDNGEEDSRGNVGILRIGDFKFTGKEFILASIADGTDKDGNPKKQIGGYWSPEEATKAKDEDDEDEDDDEDDTDEDDDEEPTPPKKSAKKAAASKKKSKADDEDDEDEKPKKGKKAAPAKKGKKTKPEPDEDDADEDDEDDDQAPF